MGQSYVKKGVNAEYSPSYYNGTFVMGPFALYAAIMQRSKETPQHAPSYKNSTSPKYNAIKPYSEAPSESPFMEHMKYSKTAAPSKGAKPSIALDLGSLIQGLKAQSERLSAASQKTLDSIYDVYANYSAAINKLIYNSSSNETAKKSAKPNLYLAKSASSLQFPRDADPNQTLEDRLQPNYT